MHFMTMIRTRLQNALSYIANLLGYARFVGILTQFLILWLKSFLGGVMVECRTPNREVLGSIPTGITVLCP